MVDKRLQKSSFWAAMSRLFSVVFAVVASNKIATMTGSPGLGTALVLSLASFGLMWFCEYERKK